MLVVILALSMGLLYIFTRYPLFYNNYIKQYSKTYSLDASLIASIINVESSYNQNAKSNKGAMGLMQILPSTAHWISQTYPTIDYTNSQQLFEPQTNIQLGCKYLKYLLDKFEHQDIAIIAYNAGEGTVMSWLNDQNYSKDGTIIKIPYKETENYLKKVKQNIKFYKYRIL